MSPAPQNSTLDTRLDALLDGCEQTFRRIGVRAVSMDDLARELGVSKKTLYKYCKDKADLVLQVFDRMCTRQDMRISDLSASGENAIDAVIQTMEYVQIELREMHPSMLFDLQKYYPAAMQRLEQHKHENMEGYLLRNVERGQREGFYRKDFDAKLISRLHMAMVQTMTKPATLEEFGRPLSELQQELHAYHLRGIATEEGMAYYHQRNRAKQAHAVS
ncbi:MAG: TetR/AcrR family transcriptional regulator [Crocinitomicaceae bacterium TMED114]|nr:MAG: TetR/AcrR family transcriptional regulator [Crocinitomicaceae bacterium TMED114]